MHKNGLKWPCLTVEILTLNFEILLLYTICNTREGNSRLICQQKSSSIHVLIINIFQVFFYYLNV
jgi:hypothetical protein